jgi:hypothetical protein
MLSVIMLSVIKLSAMAPHDLRFIYTSDKDSLFLLSDTNLNMNFAFKKVASNNCSYYKISVS